MKKIISLFLSLTMLLSLTAGLDFSAYAETVKGECGDNATYTFDSSTGLLTISGKGECYAPDSLVSKIKSVAILDGITSIGDSASFDYETVFLCDSSTGIKEANCDFTVRYIDKANKVTDFSKFNDKYEYKMDALYQWDENDKIVNRLNYFTASKTGTYYSGSNAIFDSDYNLVKSKRLNDVIDDESNHDNSGYSFQLTKGKKYYFTNGVIIKDFVYYDNGKQYIDGDISYDCLKAIFPDNKVRKFAYIANKDKLKNTQKSQFCGKSVEFKLKKPVTVKSFDVINSNKIDDNFLKNLHKEKVDNSKVTFRLNLSDSSKYTIKNSSVDFRAGWYECGEFGRYGEFNCKDGRVFGIRFGYNDNKQKS